MNLYNIKYTKDSSDDELISIATGTAEVYAASEDEAKKRLIHEFPEEKFIITSVKLMEEEGES